ncbi:phospholipase effector Tle1 domain-containing protein [Xenorhabdus griffiniae]|uniref:phospholipase effector Tle1 domain-containing protein n=1 Tax=Xenorhabdus griffiniae TaxID=351672 RepID=UPI002359F8AF|nr:DUF2235 domain-containing protein [Xenorhabdus griffiniae]MDC9607214.1 DUF2235 domain-containing protein [Xenorhabdus griffiniae]
MKRLDPTDCIDCQKILKNWIEFQLVDEQGKPLIGIPYKLKSRGNKSIVRAGTTDGKGILREEDLPPMPVTLSVSAQPLADKVTQSLPRRDTGRRGNLYVRKNSFVNKYEYQYITLGEISDSFPKVKGWQDKKLKTSVHFKDSTLKGFTAHPLNRRYVLEIQAIESGINLTIGVFFDGTGNNVDNTDERLCAKEKNDLTPEQLDKFICSFNKYGEPGDVSRLSYDNYYTNVLFLYKIYSTDEISEGNHQIKVYIEGVGTMSGESDSVWGYGTGRWLTGVITKTDIAIQRIKTALSEYLKGTKDNIRSLQFDIIGFSRGAASSRHFANRVLKQDADLLNVINECFSNHRYLAKSRYPTGYTRLLGIYDTVTAIAEPNNALNPHDSSVTGPANIFLSNNIAKHVFHITAKNECRYNFSLNSVKPSWPELELPGAHADVGGGYDPMTIETLCITRPKVTIVETSIPDHTTNVYKDAQDELSKMKKSPTIGSLLTDKDVKLVTWSEYKPNVQYPKPIKNVAAAAVLSRTIFNDWSKVGMLVMLDFAKEVGAIFDKPDDNDKNYQLPAELQPLSEKAITQGRAIRQGQPLIPFTPEELALIQSKYVHFSAHWNGVKTVNNKIHGDTYPAAIFYANRPCDDWLRVIFDINGKEI